MTRTCLFFDEMPAIRKIGERIVSTMDYKADMFETAAASMAHLESAEAPDLIILSATGEAGVDAEMVKVVRERHATSVILISLVERNIGALMRFRRAGANGILMKPFDAESFTETLAVHKRAAELAA